MYVPSYTNLPNLFWQNFPSYVTANPFYAISLIEFAAHGAADTLKNILLKKLFLKVYLHLLMWQDQ